jgi:Uma2 family endonuclease
MTDHADLRLTPEEYLRIERAAEWKSEYMDGEVFAMSGASPRHVLITANLAAELRAALRDTPCAAYPADLRVATDRHRHYTYPSSAIAPSPRSPNTCSSPGPCPHRALHTPAECGMGSARVE